MINPWVVLKSAMLAGPRERCSIAALTLSGFSVLAFLVFLIDMIVYDGPEYSRGSRVEVFLFLYGFVGIASTVLTIVFATIGLKGQYRKLAIISLSIKAFIVIGVPLLLFLVNLIIQK